MTKRKYPGELEALPLIAWLNETNNRSARGRVLQLLTLFQSASLKARWKAKPKLTLKQLADQTNELRSLESQINRILRRHRSCTHAWLSEQGIKLSQVVAGKHSDVADSMWPGNEFAAVEAVLSLVRIGVIQRLSACSCGNWFYMRFSHKRSCRDKCRQMEQRGSEEYKKRRREWARNNYWLHKNKNTK